MQDTREDGANQDITLQRERFSGQLSLMSGELKHVVKQSDIGGGLHDISAGKHPLLRRHHDFGRHLGHLSEGASIVDVAGDIGGNEAVEHAANADGLPREDPSVNGGFGVVHDQAADELHAGGDFPVAVLHFDFAIGVFEIGVGGSCAPVDPASEVAVAEESVVLFVGIGFDDTGFDFASELDGVSDGDRVFDGRVFDDSRFRADIDRASEEAVGANPRVTIDNDWTLRGVGGGIVS